jgi:maltose O-acetyltransferase
MNRWLTIRKLRRAQRADIRRLRALRAQHPGLDIHPEASTSLAAASFHLDPGARVRIGERVVTERRTDALRINVRTGGELVIEEGTWLRTDLGPVILHVYEDARLVIGPDCFLNGCQISAKTGVTVGRHSWIGPGSRIWDADQHDLDEERKEQRAPVVIGDHVWIASDVSVLRGVEIGDHSVIGSRSLVTGPIPPHTLAFGLPARPQSKVGDRTHVPI